MESLCHHRLVQILNRYVCNMDDIVSDFVSCDIFESRENPQRMPAGFVPDLYYNYKNKVIIGEAKTSLDFDKDHSIEQYRSYLQYCGLHSEDSLFVLIVPWDTYISAKRLIRKLKGEKSNFKIFIINDVGVVNEI
jgi:hypothetical protein